ncbi:MAG: histidine phosphatase family protein, partial [Lachnospiraceae bacterium]|nr:histidine phosphatase family protein [Lachnospiraceae bacterium]
MALFYLVRHGKASYDYMLENGFWGFGRDFAPLSEKGKQQTEITAKDIRLKNAELIVSSPYTRALQTAQIISRET